MPEKILVTGANGQLGSEIRSLVMSDELGVMNDGKKNNSKLKTQNSKFYFTDKDKLDITDEAAVRSFVEANGIDTIINCAAYTAVDKAESQPELADAINHQAVEILARLAKERGMAMVHISTDYVFDGKNYRPYIEEDDVAPQGVYGATKLLGERAMQAIDPARSIIIRTSWVYSSYGANFVKTMLRLGKERDELGVIFDQVGTPTYARDLAEAILRIVMSDELRVMNEKTIQNSKFKTQNSVGVYHYSNEGVASWYDFAKAIFEIAGIKCRVKPIETSEYPTPATRPHYSVLNKRKIKTTFNISISYWKDSLERMLSCDL